MDDCDVIVVQLPLARLRAQLAAAEKCEDYELVGTLGEQLVTAPHPLSEEDYLTLAERHEALVQKVTTACQELTRAKAYSDVKVLGAVLKELKSLDVSGLPLTGAKTIMFTCLPLLQSLLRKKMLTIRSTSGLQRMSPQRPLPPRKLAKRATQMRSEGVEGGRGRAGGQARANFVRTVGKY
jgi:hypothetical protein